MVSFVTIPHFTRTTRLKLTANLLLYATDATQNLPPPPPPPPPLQLFKKQKDFSNFHLFWAEYFFVTDPYSLIFRLLFLEF